MDFLPDGWPRAFAEASFLPVLMIADYYLTLSGRVVLEKAYLKRFRVEEYELNPLWRDDVGRLRWFNPKHLGLALLMWFATGFLLSMIAKIPYLEPWAPFLMGMLITPFAMVVARHLTNLATGMRLARHPEEVTGEVRISLAHLLAVSRHQVIGALVPLGVAAIWVRHPFLWGALAGGLALVGAHYRWARRKKNLKVPAGPPPGP